jgi:cold shock CspA family protein
VTTNVRDVRGNPLKNPYSWSFHTGAADITPPTVVKTIPVSGDIKVSASPTPTLYAFFSEKMAEATLNSSNITLHDDSADVWINVNIFASFEDYVSFGPAQAPLAYGHQYTATIGTGAKDRGGNNGLSSPYAWSFTTAINSGIDSDPILYDGADADEQRGQKWVDGTTRVQLQINAWDQVTFPLFVTAAISGHAPWTLNLTGGSNYSYESTGNESLSSGNNLVTFTVQDNQSNTVIFDRNIFIFSANPTLSLPANGATDVSTTPTFQWSYGGGDRPMYFNVAIFDGPDMSTASMVWMGYMIDQGSETHSITIPIDKKLSPNRTYYWGVRGANYDNNGETIGGLWSFTTGGTPPPAPYFTWAWVRSDDIYPPALQGSLLARVGGPSPADIVELKVTRPGGSQYIFTEDDIMRSEQIGQYYQHNFPNPLSNGTYIFSLTDSAGRTVTATKDFTYAPVPRVDYTTMAPGDNTYVNTTTPTLSWGGVGPGYYYRVAISDWNGSQSPVYLSDFIQATSITVPAGFLLPNTPYNWNVQVYDAPYGSNRSRSNGLRLSTGISSYTPQIEWILLFSDNNHYNGVGTFISTNVLGPLPNDVTLFNVTGPGLNYNFQPTDIMYNAASQHGNMYTYTNWQLGAPANGTYNFNLQTPNGNTSSSHNVTRSDIPIVDQSTLSPANNAYLTNLTPTFQWASVGSYYYRVLVEDWRQRFIIYASARSTNLFATIPAGILKPNRSYKWRVEVWDNANGTVAANRSTSGWNCFTTPRNWSVNFDPDEKTDVAVYHSASGLWFIKPSSGAADYYVGYGAPGYDPVFGDFDGDGKTDIAVYHSASGLWFIKPSSGAADYYVGYGGTGYVPVPGDYDGDGKTDVAIYHQASGLWYVKKSSDGYSFNVTYGGSGFDPVLGDFDGDGKTDFVVYHQASGLWYVMQSSNYGSYNVTYGGTGYVPVAGDYDGDGKTDIAVYHSGSGLWFIKPSSSGADYSVGYGGTGYAPIPGDYDGDGKTDIAVYHSASGLWFIKPSSGATDYYVGYGGTGYAPVNPDYLHGYVY